VTSRRYYSVRTGLNTDGVNFDLTVLQRYLKGLYLDFYERCFFQEAFGYFCVDAGDVPGLLGSNIETRVVLALRKESIWPIEDRIEEYSEDDCFDVIEFLYEHISKPVKGRYCQMLWIEAGMVAILASESSRAMDGCPSGWDVT